MLTLSYGFLKPQTGDKGAPLFSALEGDIQQLNDHDHDGVNSAPLTASSIIAITANILSANWIADSVPGFFYQQITTPAGISYDTVQIGFRLTTGEYVYPTVEKVSNTQYILRVNQNVNLVAVYGG